MSEPEYFDSGPFCRHYGDPSGCQIKCERCGHECCHHEQPSFDPVDTGTCMIAGCTCEGWVEPT